jgi:hypothetical protein
LEALKLDSSDGKIRKQPYCVVLTGYPGCGKTSFAMKIASECIKAKYGSFYPSDIVTLNETDEFQSEFRTNHKVVVFDDVAAENSDRTVVNPWRKVIDFVNNVKKTSLNPNVELKGNVYIEPDLVILTTNMQYKGGFRIHTFMLNSTALLRRFKKVFYLGRSFSHCQEVTYDLIVPSDFDVAYNMHYEENLLEEIPREEAVQDIVKDFLDHNLDQGGFVQQVNGYFTRSHSEENSALAAFVEDVIKPRWFHVCELDSLHESQLPVWRRMLRKLCFKKQMAMCQASSLSSESESFGYAFVPQSGTEDKFRSYFERFYDYDRDTISTEAKVCHLEGTEELTLWLYLCQNIKIDSYLVFFHEISETQEYVFSRIPQSYHSGEISCAHASLCPDRSIVTGLQLKEFIRAFYKVKRERQGKVNKSTMTPLEAYIDTLPKYQTIYGWYRLIAKPKMKPKPDIYHEQFFSVLPSNLTLIGYEWDNPEGRGDFVFADINEDLVYVVEIGQRKIKPIRRQAELYARQLKRTLSFHGLSTSVIAVAMTMNAVEINGGFVSAESELMFRMIHEKFVGHCGVTGAQLSEDESPPREIYVENSE